MRGALDLVFTLAGVGGILVDVVVIVGGLAREFLGVGGGLVTVDVGGCLVVVIGVAVVGVARRFLGVG